MAQNALVWLPINEAIESVPCTCIDGRTQGMRYSAAGGSFAIALHIVASCMQSPTRARIKQALLRFSEQVGPLYYHTDEAAYQRWLHASGIHPELPLSQADQSQQQQLLNTSGELDHVGCGHVQLMLKDPERYMVDRDTTKMAIAAFFELWLAGTDKVVFEVLEGEHNESHALFLESVDGHDDSTTLHGGEEVFFCHRPLKYAVFERYAKVLGVQASAQTLYEQHNKLAEHTLSQLAPHLPHARLNVGVQS